jgi:hypothetical protein
VNTHPDAVPLAGRSGGAGLRAVLAAPLRALRREQRWQAGRLEACRGTRVLRARGLLLRRDDA